jgi:hypothetical protein
LDPLTRHLQFRRDLEVQPVLRSRPLLYLKKPRARRIAVSTAIARFPLTIRLIRFIGTRIVPARSD